MTYKRKIAGIGALGALLMIGIGVALSFQPSRITHPGSLHFSLIYNPENDREVVGAFDHVFTGKVIEVIGLHPYSPDDPKDPLIQTLFRVEVAYNIKGNLRGEIIVGQLGGDQDGVHYRLNKEGNLYSTKSLAELDDSDLTLQVGSTYLFATKFDPELNRHLVSSHPSGLEKLSDNPTLDKEGMILLSKEHRRVQELMEAFKNEIMPYVNKQLDAGTEEDRYK